jgi:hypothetical protein
LIDFVVDWTSPPHNPGEGIVTPWVVHCDGLGAIEELEY